MARDSKIIQVKRASDGAHIGVTEEIFRSYPNRFILLDDEKKEEMAKATTKKTRTRKPKEIDADIT